jgi:glycine dehydrogenase subunit 1
VQYFPHSEKEIQEMEKVIGISSINELFKGIPAELLNHGMLNSLPDALNEADLLREMRNLGDKNLPLNQTSSFLGGGSYRHFIPAVVDYLASRGEFLTPYTPYQPEVSQGTLQALFEFQTMVCELTGLEVSNSSLYDGAMAAAEAILMAKRITGKHKFLISHWLHPEYLETIQTYTKYQEIELITVGSWDSGQTPLTDIEKEISKRGAEIGALIIQSPNFAGVIEDIKNIKKSLDSSENILLIVVGAEAMSLGYLNGPGKQGADIFAGEGQSFGIYPQAGGPHIGILATHSKYIRNLPGRLVGETCELAQAGNQNPRKGFVLTLSTREQHIRREKATSNICTNHGLMAIRVAIFLSLYGRRGLFEVSRLNHLRALYLRNKISNDTSWKLTYPDSPVFNEFIVQCPRNLEKFIEHAKEKNILPGIRLNKFFPERKNELLVTTTEENTLAEIDELVQCMQSFAK